MHLQEDSLDAFALSVNWLYRAKFEVRNTQSHLDNLMDLYIFADKICLTGLKDRCIDTIQDIALNKTLAMKSLSRFLQNYSRIPLNKGLDAILHLRRCRFVRCKGEETRKRRDEEYYGHQNLQTIWTISKDNFELAKEIPPSTSLRTNQASGSAGCAAGRH